MGVTRRDLLLASAGLLGCGESSMRSSTQERMASAKVLVAAPPPEPKREPAPVASASATKPKETPHVLTVPSADAASGAPRGYTVTADGHTHPITVDAAAMGKLRASGFALVRSGTGGPTPHRHWVSVHVA